MAHAHAFSAHHNNGMTLLSELLLAEAAPSPGFTSLSKEAFQRLRVLAEENHVIVRGFNVLFRFFTETRDETRMEWTADALAVEHARIENAIAHLQQICRVFAEEGHEAAVIKSLDHWPDLGSDLDLYTDTDSRIVCEMMARRFNATVAQRSWGDRLAGKWNFNLPGLPEAVEIHMGRLGQTGEQRTLASWLMQRSRLVERGGYTFRVPSASDRLMISTLQRMYRHFYFRLCDVVDSGQLVEAGEVDFDDLMRSAREAGIWEGVATYLAIVSDYTEKYRGRGIQLPQFVRSAARFGGEHIYFAKSFLRVPLLPQSAALYGSQLGGMLRRRELHNSARLGLLPWLATAAVVGQKITGSDKGIW